MSEDRAAPFFSLTRAGWWPNKDPEFDDLCALRRWKLREASDGLSDDEFDPAEDVEWLVEDLRVSMATW
jgi:hypothetical protein